MSGFTYILLKCFIRYTMHLSNYDSFIVINCLYYLKKSFNMLTTSSESLVFGNILECFEVTQKPDRVLSTKHSFSLSGNLPVIYDRIIVTKPTPPLYTHINNRK